MTITVNAQEREVVYCMRAVSRGGRDRIAYTARTVRAAEKWLIKQKLGETLKKEITMVGTGANNAQHNKTGLFLLCFAVAVLFSLPHQAAAEQRTLKGGYPACVSKQKLDEYYRAWSNKDGLAMAYLLENGCIVTKPGIPISKLDNSLTTAKVRAYSNGGSVVLWVPIESLN